MELLESMAKDHVLSPRWEHYACVVDLLGWAGLLTKAKHFIDGLPENLQALLGSCSIHGDSEMGIYAANQFFQQHLKAQHPIFYCPLSIFFRREMERESKDY